MKILALDPGGTTGLALFNGKAPEAVSKFTTWQLGPADHHQELYTTLWRELTQVTNMYLVCERFEYRNASRPGLDLSSREYIGVAKLFNQESTIPVVFQNASQAKGFVEDRHIQKLGLWSGGNKHAMDAMRHLLYFMIHSGTAPEMAKALLERGWK